MPSKRNKRRQAVLDAVAMAHIDDKLLCAICMEAPEKAMVTDSCGHLFCESCVNKLFEKSGPTAPCPVCRTPFDKNTINHSVYVQRQVDALPIECPSDGCDWYRERSEVPNHLRTCPEAIVACPHSTNGCSTKAKRKDILTHAANCQDAIIPCVHAADGCEQEMKRRDAPAHLDTCSHASIQCPNDGCNAQTKRKESSKHQEECPHAVVSCPFSTHGCDKKVKRKDVENHLKEQEVAHLKLKVGTLEKSHATLQKECDVLKKECEVLKTGVRTVVSLPLSPKGSTKSEPFPLFGERWYLSTEVGEEYRTLYLHLSQNAGGPDRGFKVAFSLKLFAIDHSVEPEVRTTCPSNYTENWGFPKFVSKNHVEKYTTHDNVWFVEVTINSPPTTKVLDADSESGKCDQSNN